MSRKSNFFKIAVAAFIAVVLAGIAILVRAFKPAPPVKTPIVIAGGSIHSCAPSGWAKNIANEYSGTPLNTTVDYITFQGFTDSPSQTFTGTGGWKISYSTVDTSNAMQICTDPGCSGLMDGTGKLYFQVDPAHARITEHLANNKIDQIHFHERVCDPQGDETELTGCNALKTIQITSTNPIGMPASLSCPGPPRRCNVIVGEGTNSCPMLQKAAR